MKHTNFTRWMALSIALALPIVGQSGDGVRDGGDPTTLMGLLPLAWQRHSVVRAPDTEGWIGNARLSNNEHVTRVGWTLTFTRRNAQAENFGIETRANALDRFVRGSRPARTRLEIPIDQAVDESCSTSRSGVTVSLEVSSENRTYIAPRPCWWNLARPSYSLGSVREVWLERGSDGEMIEINEPREILSRLQQVARALLVQFDPLDPETMEGPATLDSWLNRMNTHIDLQIERAIEEIFLDRIAEERNELSSLLNESTNSSGDCVSAAYRRFTERLVEWERSGTCGTMSRYSARGNLPRQDWADQFAEGCTRLIAPVLFRHETVRNICRGFSGSTSNQAFQQLLRETP